MSNSADPAAFFPNALDISTPLVFNGSHSSPRLSRPPVPLFHSTQDTIQHTQLQYTSDFTDFTMAGGGNSSPSSFSISSDLTLSPSDVNVAFDGTFDDLAMGGDVSIFTNGSFDFELMGPTQPDTRFTAINSYGTGVTVSPKDLLQDSMPPSTTFTNLSTPGSTFLETPADEYQTSPLFSDGLDSFSSFPSLFPDEHDSTPAAPAPVKMERQTSATQVMVHPGGDSLNPRKRSSTIAPSPIMSPLVRHSDVAGVGARKRDKPLPPIMVDQDDPVALKRARNTAAARKSRAKKVEERDGLEGQIAALQARVAELESERDQWKAKALAGDL